MLSQPPIDELASKASGNKYKLCCLVSKRAKELESKIPAQLESENKKSIQYACDEIYSGKIVASEDNID